jgi:hypothetical protein
MTGIKFFVELADQADAKLKIIEEDALKKLRFYKEQKNILRGLVIVGPALKLGGSGGVDTGRHAWSTTIDTDEATFHGTIDTGIVPSRL